MPIGGNAEASSEKSPAGRAPAGRKENVELLERARRAEALVAALRDENRKLRARLAQLGESWPPAAHHLS